MKNNRIIDKEVIENASPDSIFAYWSFHDKGSTNICNTGKELKWVAVRGWIPDWAVYFEPCYADEYSVVPWSNNRIKNIWNKLPTIMLNEIFEHVSDKAIEVYRD